MRFRSLPSFILPCLPLQRSASITSLQFTHKEYPLLPYLPSLLTFHLAVTIFRPDGTGQTCDAINLCAGGTCPKGMDKVAIPERSDTYHIRTSRGANPADDPASYIPGERVTIWITVTKKLIQRRMNKGVKTCLCDYPERARVKSNCLPVTVCTSYIHDFRQYRATSSPPHLPPPPHTHTPRHVSSSTRRASTTG